MTVLRDQSHKVPDIERVQSLITRLENQYHKKTIFVIADMSVFHHLKRAKELLGYEKSLHRENFTSLIFINLYQIRLSSS